MIESERNAIRKRHLWKLLEEQDRVVRSYYAQREGFDRGEQGTQGQTGLGREHVGHGYVCKRQKRKIDWCGVTRWVTDLRVSVGRISVGTRRFWLFSTDHFPRNKLRRETSYMFRPSNSLRGETKLGRELYRRISAVYDQWRRL